MLSMDMHREDESCRHSLVQENDRCDTKKRRNAIHQGDPEGCQKKDQESGERKKEDAKRIKGMQEKERVNAGMNSKGCWKRSRDDRKIKGCKKKRSWDGCWEKIKGSKKEG